MRDENNNKNYGFIWIGKNEAMQSTYEPTNKILKPDIKSSVDPDNTENIYIEGDNLEALKILQKNYLNKIKMIYIDPPYNTGKNFIYKDNFDTNDKFHSNWCSMMYPRLKLAKNLLTQDGVMFISIDENESHRLFMLCSEIFGENNLDEIIWQKMDSRYDRNTNAKVINRIKSVHEMILVCYKNKKQTFFGKIKKLPEWKNKQSNPDNDKRGKYKQGIISYKEGHKNEDRTSENYYSILTPTGKIYTRHFFISKEEYIRLEKDNRIYYPNGGNGVPALKIFEGEEQYYKLESIIRGLGTSSIAKDEIGKIFNDRDLFPTPKPTKLIKELVRLIDSKDSIILDFFSGSATTADSIMQLNAEDGGCRKFIMVQLPETIDKKSKAYKLGYKNICEIGKERIRRQGQKIREENPDKKLDVGFRVYKICDKKK